MFKIRYLLYFSVFAVIFYFFITNQPKEPIETKSIENHTSKPKTDEIDTLVYSLALLKESEKGITEDRAKFLLKNGADVNFQNKDWNTALIFASSNGYYKMVKFLLENGADIYHENRDRNTALGFAVSNRDLEVIKLFLEHGADPNYIGRYSGTALIVASLNGYYEIVEFLLENGADVNATGMYSYTALMVASDNGDLEIVKLLLRYGAVDETNNFGNSAFYIAELREHQEILKILKILKRNQNKR